MVFLALDREGNAFVSMAASVFAMGVFGGTVLGTLYALVSLYPVKGVGKGRPSFAGIAKTREKKGLAAALFPSS